MSKKKPPEKNKENTINENIYTIIKCPLKSVLKKYDVINSIINDAVNDINEITILGYQFIKLYLIHLFNNNNKEIPVINKQFILDIITPLEI